MAHRVPIKELQRRVDFLRRNLVRGGIATEEEVTSVASRFAGKRDKDSLWECWAELKALAIARAVTRESRISREALEVAVKALKDEPAMVHLDSINMDIIVRPASWERISVIEEHEWWINRLLAARSILMSQAMMGEAEEKVCSECNRPLEPGNLSGTLKRIREELVYQRKELYSQVVASGPAPTDERIDWSNKITPVEDLLLRETYHRVNFDVIQNLPSPRSEDGERDLPRSWAFMFSAMEDRQRKPALHFMRDKSLGSIIAYLVIQTIREQAATDKAKSSREGNKNAGYRKAGTRSAPATLASSR